MAEDKLLKDKKTKEIKDDIYALDLDFEYNEEEMDLSSIKSKSPVNTDEESGSIRLKGYEETEDEEPKKR